MKSLLLLISLAVSPAYAATAQEMGALLEARLKEIQDLRAMRISNKVPPFSATERGNAARGVTYYRSSGGWVYGVRMFNLPIAKLWAGLNDETRQPGYTAVEYSELLSGAVCKSGRHVFQYLPMDIPFVDDRWWIGILTENRELYRVSGGSVRELAWRSSTDLSELSPSALKLAKSATPIGYTRGAWLLVAIDDRHTWVEYHGQSDPGEGIPLSLATKLAPKGVERTFEAQERFAREGNPSCPVY